MRGRKGEGFLGIHCKQHNYGCQPCNERLLQAKKSLFLRLKKKEALKILYVELTVATELCLDIATVNIRAEGFKGLAFKAVKQVAG